MKKLLLFALLCFSFGLGHSLKAEYDIKSIGIKLADLAIELKADKIWVHSKSIRSLPGFPHQDNIYEVAMASGSKPKTYLRLIHQGELRDSVYTVYKENVAVMHTKKEGLRREYPFEESTRDFFSFLHLVGHNIGLKGKFKIDGNGRLWLAKLDYKGEERLTTKLGNFQSHHYELSFSPLSPVKAPYIDMLTHNLLSEDLKLSIWFSDSAVPLKAELKKKLLIMNWEIRDIAE